MAYTSLSTSTRGQSSSSTAKECWGITKEKLAFESLKDYSFISMYIFKPNPPAADRAFPGVVSGSVLCKAVAFQ